MEEKGGRTQPGTGRMIPLGRVAALETEAARERAEAALEESERRVRLFFEGAPLPCQLLDGEG
jgi:PAS domain-containing protein